MISGPIVDGFYFWRRRSRVKREIIDENIHHNSRSYKIDHNVTLISILCLQIYIDFLLGSLFLFDDTQVRTTEDQAYKRTVYLLDHSSVTLISILFPQIKLITE